MQPSSVKGEVAVVSGRQLVLRADGGNLMMVALGDDTVIHQRDEQLDPNTLVRGTPVRIRYRPQDDGVLHALDVSLMGGE